MSLNIAQQFIKGMVKIYFGLSKIQVKFLINKSNLIKEKLTELIEQTFNRECSLYLACNDKMHFFT